MSTPEQRIRDFYGFDFPEDFFRCGRGRNSEPPESHQPAAITTSNLRVGY